MEVAEKPVAYKQVIAKHKIPILHIIKSLGRGGAETLLPETLSLHDQERFEFHYIYFLPWKYQMVEDIRREGGIVTCFPARNNIEIMLQVRKIAAYVKQHKIRLIHCHLPWAGIVGRVVGKLCKVPVVYTEHNTWDHYHKLTYHLNKISFGNQQQVIAVSKDVARSIKTHYGKSRPPVTVVSNGINTDKFSRHTQLDRNIRKELGISADTVVIGIACVFRPQKRLLLWLEIAAMIHKNHPNTFFIIAGDGPMKEEVHQKAKELRLTQNLHFAGLQFDIRPYTMALDIFMMSSEFEGMPIALLEAMSMECLPACTAVGGIPELIDDNVNGILVDGKEPLKLAERLSPYINHPERIRSLGQVARRTVTERFGMDDMVTELEGIYNTLIV